MRTNLAGYSLFAAMLAAAGLPIYIHAPKFYADEYGIGLGALGGVLFVLRLLDVVQDPALGWLSRKLRHRRAVAVAIGAGVMALSMIGLFAIAPPVSPALWFGLTLAFLFSGYSFLTISFYAQGVAKADILGENGHVRLAGWRETGALLGVSLAAVLPTVLGFTGAPFAIFALAFAALALFAVFAMRGEWRATETPSTPGFRPILEDRQARRILLIALLNATPVAVTSTLFLFFVDARLGAPGWEGPLLLLFFLSAAASAPFWSRAAQSFGAKTTLLAGMALAIVTFGGAAFLGEGDVWWFALICLVSGATLGADLTLLPAIFAARAARIAPEAAEGFGLWSFVTKFSLAIAAVALLPLLEATGFNSGANSQPAAALTALSLMYAILPCALKVVAIVLLYATDLDESAADAQIGAT